MTTDDRLVRIEDKIDKQSDKIEEIRVSVEHRVTALEVKAGFWGALGGILAAIGAWLVQDTR